MRGLKEPARVVIDSDFVPHILAASDRDAVFLLGFNHARDRLFQMDYLRRIASGTAAELLGRDSLRLDIWLRTLGLRRAAEASLIIYPREVRALLDAYAGGVNAYLQDPANPLPPEYAELRLTRASVPAWTAVDSLTVLKFFSFLLSYGEGDVGNTAMLDAYQQAGQEHGFDGASLHREIGMRSEPFDLTTTIPGFLDAQSSGSEDGRATRTAAVETARLSKPIPRDAVELARRYRSGVRQMPFQLAAVKAEADRGGSNWFIVSGRLTATGRPLVANDPHLEFNLLWALYETHLTVENESENGPMNVAGVGLPGIPAVLWGSNERASWTIAMNPMDVTDVFREELKADPGTGLPAFSVFEGQTEPLTTIPQSFRVNRRAGESLDNVTAEEIAPLDGGTTFVVPRHGPIIKFDAAAGTALSVQYTGFAATRELQTFLEFARARNLTEFRSALRHYSVGSVNWGYADMDGVVASTVSGKMPLRFDLETTGQPHGLPPYFVRDGTSHWHEWIRDDTPGREFPYKVLPPEEMPQAVNPPQGFLVAANNDPVGVTIGNNPLAHLRPTGGAYYLSPSYDGFRVGQLTAAITERLKQGPVRYDDLARLQANNQMLAARVLVPYLDAAFRNAQASEEGTEMANLGSDPGVTEAVAALRDWDSTTPAGLPDFQNPARQPSGQEVKNSGATTVYNVWQAQVVKNVIDGPLERAGLKNQLPASDKALSALRHLLDNFAQDRGSVAGVDFFALPEAGTTEMARDLVLLRSLKEALQMLRSDSFAAAFHHSGNLADYRWGKLHRFGLYHPLGGRFNIPPGGGFAELGPGFPGIPHGGGFEVPDASGNPIRISNTADCCMFSSGAASRHLYGFFADGIRIEQILAGGQSQIPGSPGYANMLSRWVRNEYHIVPLTTGQVDGTARVSETLFVPAAEQGQAPGSAHGFAAELDEADNE